MAARTPWLTSNSLIEAIKRKISMPLAQNAVTLNDVLQFANDEMAISQVPSMLQYQEEYFVYPVEVPLVSGVSKYAIPDRAIGMRLRDVFVKDNNGNLNELVRISPDDKSYWQGGSNSNDRFYIEGNSIVLSPASLVAESQTDVLVFYIYLRPNQLVLNSRAIICSGFSKNITVGTVIAGDTLTIGSQIYTAVVAAPAVNEFVIGATSTITASNLVAAIGSGASVLLNVIAISCGTSCLVITGGATLVVSSLVNAVFTTNIPTTWTDPDTLMSEPLFANGSLVDFLQTKPGHRTYSYDIAIQSIGSNFISFASIPTGFAIGDYICLANECIIPQIPPDLHNGLAERAGARILASIGDQAGLQTSMAKIQEIDARQSTLLDNRVTGAPMKVSGRGSILRRNKSRNWGY